MCFMCVLIFATDVAEMALCVKRHRKTNEFHLFYCILQYLLLGHCPPKAPHLKPSCVKCLELPAHTNHNVFCCFVKLRM